MLGEFFLLTGTEESAVRERWMRCQERVMQYAPLEQKKTVKNLLSEMKLTGDENEGMHIVWLCEFKCKL